MLDISFNKINNWGEDIELLLFNMQQKSLELSKQYKSDYIKYRSLANHFKIPIIVMSSIATFVNFSLQPYMDQLYISIITTSLTFFTGLLGTIELYLQLQKKMEHSLNLSKELYMNSLEITKILSLDIDRRTEDANEYLEKRYKHYINIIGNSEIMPDGDILFKRRDIPNKLHNTLTRINTFETKNMIKPIQEYAHYNVNNYENNSENQSEIIEYININDV